MQPCFISIYLVTVPANGELTEVLAQLHRSKQLERLKMPLLSSCSFCPSARSYCPGNLAEMGPSYSSGHCSWHLSWCKDIFTHFSLLNLRKMQQLSEKGHNREWRVSHLKVTFLCSPSAEQHWVTWRGPYWNCPSLTREKYPALPCPKGFQVFCIINGYICMHWSACTPLCHGNFMDFEEPCRSLPAQDICDSVTC